ncbi:unnamed protein product [Soboliphyme baturini]|uniref:ShKT domain-containing protein n=1 Tax=Soboliphyme baturini TaxID=241478 RepID=A0A183JB62_9BILA|nr:unnamed protein product [Soboliphyme baturini]
MHVVSATTLFAYACFLTIGTEASLLTRARTKRQYGPPMQPQPMADREPVMPVAPPQMAAYPGTCQDQHTNCCFWASQNQCNVNPYYMRSICQNSCGTCGCQIMYAPMCQVALNIAACSVPVPVAPAPMPYNPPVAYPGKCRFYTHITST